MTNLDQVVSGDQSPVTEKNDYQACLKRRCRSLLMRYLEGSADQGSLEEAMGDVVNEDVVDEILTDHLIARLVAELPRWSEPLADAK